jgi:hypothetical protein
MVVESVEAGGLRAEGRGWSSSRWKRVVAESVEAGGRRVEGRGWSSGRSRERSASEGGDVPESTTAGFGRATHGWRVGAEVRSSFRTAVGGLVALVVFLGEPPTPSFRVERGGRVGWVRGSCVAESRSDGRRWRWPSNVSSERLE